MFGVTDEVAVAELYLQVSELLWGWVGQGMKGIDPETKGFNMLTAELEAFAASVASKTPFPTPLAEIRHGVSVFEAILRSTASGRPEMVAG